MIELTAEAARQINLVLEDSGEDLEVRVAARLGADGQARFALGFDEQREGDTFLEAKGVRLLIGECSRDLLRGFTIDFARIGEGEHGFLFIAPERGCAGCTGGDGCSSSSCSEIQVSQ